MAQKRDIPTLNNANFLDILQKNGLSEDQFWAKSLQEMIKLEQSEFVFTRLAKKERIPKQAGTKRWTTRRYLHLPVDLAKGILSEGLAPKPMRVEGKTVSGTVNQYGAYIELTDVAVDIHFDDIRGIYQPELARHAAETIERVMIEAIDAEASVHFTGTATEPNEVESLGAVLKFDDVRRAWLTMRNHRRSGHPLAGGKPILVAHPNVLQDLLDDDNIIANLIIKPGYDSKIIKSGSINEYTVYGVHFLETTVIEPEGGAYPSYLVGKDAFVQLSLGSDDVKWYSKGFTADSNDPLGQKMTFGYKLWTGGKIIDPIAVTKFYSKSGFDTSAADWAIDRDAQAARQGFYNTTADGNIAAVLRIAKAPADMPASTDNSAITADDRAQFIVTLTDTYGSEILIPIEDVSLATGAASGGKVTITASYTFDAEDTANVTKTATFVVDARA